MAGIGRTTGEVVAVAASAGEPFETGRAYSAAEITAVVGGQETQAFPIVDRTAVAIRTNRQASPDAPTTVGVGDRPREVRAARSLVTSGAIVPVFVREEPTADFVFQGRYRVVGELDTSHDTLDAHRVRTGRSVAGVLHLERMS